MNPEWRRFARRVRNTVRRRARSAQARLAERVSDAASPSEYQAWLAEGAALADLPPAGDESGTPTFSIVMPVYRPPMPFLTAAVESVLGQTVGGWHLILVDDRSDSDEITAYLADAAAASRPGRRVSVIRREQNGGISAALNDGLAAVDGDYVGVLDHDDLLDPRCIEEFRLRLQQDPLADVVYSDEDKVDADGNHREPYFKPDFSPDLLLSHMYLCHFTVFRTSLVRSVGGFRSGFDGAQDHDLALRVTERTDRVAHIPLVLYHWRAWEQSTALTIEAKPWAQDAARRVQEDFLGRQPGGGTAAPSPIRGLNDPRYGAVPGARVSIVIPTASRVDTEDDAGRHHVDLCLASLEPYLHDDTTELVIVHTGPLDEDQVHRYHRLGAVLVAYDRPSFNFSRAVNLGVAAASGSHVLLLNDDTRAEWGDPIGALLEYSQQPGVGAVGAKLTYPDGRLQHVGMLMVGGMPTHPYHRAPADEFGYFGSILTVRNYLAVTAAALMTPRTVFEDVGGFDESFAHDFNDVDYCLRVVASGRRVVWTPYAHLTHVESASIQRHAPDADEAAEFTRRWSARYPQDPFYSPRLSQSLTSLYQPL